MTGVVKELWSQQLLKEQGLLYVKLTIFSTKFQNTYFFYNWWFKLWHIGKSEVALSCPTLCDPVDCSPPAPLSMRFSRQEYWSGLSFPSPGDLPDPGVEPRSPTLWADALTSEPPGNPDTLEYLIIVEALYYCVLESPEPFSH